MTNTELMWLRHLLKSVQKLFFQASVKLNLIGGAEWDRIVLVRYPGAGALLQMAQSEAYRAISGNRNAGLEGQMNLAVFESPPVSGDSVVTELSARLIICSKLIFALIICKGCLL